MRRAFTGIVTCLLVAGLGLAPTALGDSPSGAATVDARWTKAVLAGDLEGVMACYAKGAVLWMPGAPMAKGEEQIRAAYKDLFANFTVKAATLSETEYKTSGNMSTGWGRYTMTMSPKKGGADVTESGRFTEVAMRHKASWVYIVDHASADPAPATK